MEGKTYLNIHFSPLTAYICLKPYTGSDIKPWIKLWIKPGLSMLSSREEGGGVIIVIDPLGDASNAIYMSPVT